MTPYYDDGTVVLWLGDCREQTAWLGGDVMVTDPPYGIRWLSGAFTTAKVPIYQRVVGDADTAARDTVLAAWGERPAVVFGSWRQPRPERTRHRLIWYKSKSAPGLRPAPWFPAEEEIYILGDGFTGAPEQNVIVSTVNRGGPHSESQRLGHPTVKPVGLMERLIAKCPPGVIVDPFAGTGSTLIAARAQGRAAIGVECEESYCETAARRLAQDALFV